MVDTVQCRIALIHPLRTLCCAFSQLLASFDVIGELGPKFGDLRRQGGSGRGVVVSGQRALQSSTSRGDRAEVSRMPCVKVFTYRPVVCHQSLQDGVRASGERSTFALHPPHGLGGLAGGPGRYVMADEDDRGHRRQAQSQATADSKARTPATTPGRDRRGQERRFDWRRLGGSLLHMT